jgi:hypothetical protein
MYAGQERLDRAAEIPWRAPMNTVQLIGPRDPIGGRIQHKAADVRELLRPSEQIGLERALSAHGSRNS